MFAAMIASLTTQPQILDALNIELFVGIISKDKKVCLVWTDITRVN